MRTSLLDERRGANDEILHHFSLEEKILLKMLLHDLQA